MDIYEWQGREWWKRGPYHPRHRIGVGSIFTHFEQHWRGGGRTRGKKQIHRFPQTMLQEMK